MSSLLADKSQYNNVKYSTSALMSLVAANATLESHPAVTARASGNRLRALSIMLTKM